jgi:signal transduction histidine kinase
MVHHEPMKSPPSGPVSDRFAAVLAGLAVLIAVAGAVIATAYDRAGTGDFGATLSFAFAVGAVAVTGAVIILVIPGNRVGWLLVTAAAVMGAGVACTEAGVHGVVTAPGSVPGAGYLAGFGPGLQAAGMLIAVIGVPAVFPDGRLPGPRWRWLAWCTAVAVACLFLGNVLSPHAQQSRLAHWQSPVGLPSHDAGIANLLSTGGVLLAVVAAAGAIAGLVVRWRRGGPFVRQQLLFLALAAIPPAVVLVVVIATNGVPGWVFGAVLLPLPVAIAVAILSHGLYDLRRAAQRTLLWLTMSGCVAGLYAVVVIAAASLIHGRHTWWPSALAATAAALLLVPLREKLQRGVTRLVYGRWHEPYDVLAGLGENLEAAADIDRLLAAVVAELGTGLDLRDVSVRDLDGTVVTGAASGQDDAVSEEGSTPGGESDSGGAPGAGDGGAGLPVLAYGMQVGWLTYRPPGRPLSTAEQRLLRDLARQLGGVLHARMLRADLQRARERLVLAREEERRRLRRDLHDGIGPALAGLTLKAETARALLPPGTGAASRQLHDLGEEIRQMVGDVRRLVEGLRPPALDELGLAGACAQAAERLTAGAAAGLSVSVTAGDDLPALPAAVEVAAYRIVVEAVTNTFRHAGARRCQVSMAMAAGSAVLEVAVTDDGTGLPAAGHDGRGHGLAIMRERAEELGGAVTITNGSPGVTVRAWLPAMPSPAPVPVAATATTEEPEPAQEPGTAQPEAPRVPAMPG